jgi:hypothetical protein
VLNKVVLYQPQNSITQSQAKHLKKINPKIKQGQRKAWRIPAPKN